jgi:hypothetical protein
MSSNHVENEIHEYRKIPLTIKAVRLTKENFYNVLDWCDGETYSKPPMRQITGIYFPTIEGHVIAEFGEWVLQGIDGEFYPCKDHIFRETYEIVS